MNNAQVREDEAVVDLWCKFMLPLTDGLLASPPDDSTLAGAGTQACGRRSLPSRPPPPSVAPAACGRRARGSLHGCAWRSGLLRLHAGALHAELPAGPRTHASPERQQGVGGSDGGGSVVGCTLQHAPCARP